MNEKFPIQAISDVTEPDKIRVVIFINGELVHVPLAALLKSLKAEIDALDERVTVRETP